MQFQWVDLIILAVIALSSLTGLFRGFIKELIALGIWVVAIWAAYKYSYALDPWLQGYISDKSASTIVAFVIILIGVLISGGILNALLGLILSGTGLGGMDKLLGAIFGFSRGVFIVSLIIAIMSMTSLPYQKYLQGSRLYPQLLPVVTWIYGYLPKLINQVKSADISGLIDISSEKTYEATALIDSKLLKADQEPLSILEQG
ncbi:MAG: CvpA family protein [Legionella sp.]